MRLRSRSSLTTRFVTFVSGVALLFGIAVQVLDRLPALGGVLTGALFLLLILAIGVAPVVIMVWAVVGNRNEWFIGDGDIRIRSRRLTSWQPDILISPEQIATIDRETHTFRSDGDSGLPCHSLVVTLKDGRRFDSPRLFDDAELTRAWRKLEALLPKG